MYDEALKRKMAQEFASIEQTTFWKEFVKALEVHKKYHRDTLDKSENDRAIARAQGSVATIEKVNRIPLELTGLDKAPEE